MKKFTKYVSSIIVFCLLLAGNDVYSKADSFFGTTKQKAEWNKKGFSSTIAKPDLRLSNISVILSSTCTQTITAILASTTNTATQTGTSTATSTTIYTVTNTVTQTNIAIASGTATNTYTGTTTENYTFLPPVIGTPVASLASITIPITSVAAGTTGYKVYKKTGAGAFVLLTPTFQTNFTQFIDVIVPQPLTTYSYYIEATNAAGCLSGASNTTLVNTAALPTPTNVQAVAKSPTSVFVSWADIAGEENYELSRSVNGVDYVSLATIVANGLSYLDNSVFPDKDYYYIVRGKFGTGPGPFSTPATLVHTPPLPAPTNLNATSISCSQINLTWTDASGAYAKENYILERSENGGGYVVVNNNIPALATSYSDNALKPNTSYAYRIVAKYGVGPSNYSNIASAATKPLNLNIGQYSATTASINWNLCSPFVQAWKIYVSVNDSPYTEFAQATAVLDNYTLKNLLPNTKYAVYLVTVFGAGIGGASNTIVFNTPKFPGPTNLTVTPSSTTSLKVNWLDNSNGPDNEEGFVLYKSIDNGVTYSQIQILPTKTEFIDTGLKASQKAFQSPLP